MKFESLFRTIQGSYSDQQQVRINEGLFWELLVFNASKELCVGSSGGPLSTQTLLPCRKQNYTEGETYIVFTKMKQYFYCYYLFRSFSKWLIFLNTYILFIFLHWFFNASHHLQFCSVFWAQQLPILPPSHSFSNWLLFFKSLTLTCTDNPFTFPWCLNVFLFHYKPEAHLSKHTGHLYLTGSWLNVFIFGSAEC